MTRTRTCERGDDSRNSRRRGATGELIGWLITPPTELERSLTWMQLFLQDGQSTRIRAQSFHSACRQRRPLSCVVSSLDHFEKPYTNTFRGRWTKFTFSHLFGDQIETTHVSMRGLRNRRQFFRSRTYTNLARQLNPLHLTRRRIRWDRFRILPRIWWPYYS